MTSTGHSARDMEKLKSWNEWAEGNYMEPDLQFGKGYIRAMRSVLEEYMNAKF